MKRITLSLAFAAIAMATSFAQTPQLVKDVNTATMDADPILTTNVNGTLYFFVAKSYSTAHTLWKSDGTAGGTVNVTSDASFDYYSSTYVPSMTGAFGNRFYWVYDKKLNISDGTAAGTITLNTFANGIASVFNTGTKLFITANSGGSNPVAEVWVSDGTVAGTTLLKSFSNPPPNSSFTYNYFYNPVVVNNTLVFFIYTPTNAGACCQLNTWKSDGTVGGTVALGDQIWDNPFAFQNKLYYFNGGGLYQTDENFTSSTLINAIQYRYTAHFQRVQAGSYMYFTHGSNAVPGTGGDELWRTDGTNAGTIKLYTTPDGSEIKNLTAANGNAYFVSGYNLYQSTGTVAGTTVMKDFSTLTGGLASWPANLTGSGTILYFSAYTKADNIELWKSDGTAAGTTRVNSTFSPGIDGLSPAYLTPFGVNGIAFAGTGNTVGRELFTSGGTSVSNVVDLFTQPGSSSPANLTSTNNAVYFTATTAASGMEMWQTDGTSGGTSMVVDANPSGSSSPSEVVKSITDSVFWKAFDGANVGLYNNSNRHLLQRFPLPDPNVLHFYSSAIDNVLYFNGYDAANGDELWRYNQGLAQRISDIGPGSAYAFTSNYFKYNNDVYFYASTPSNAATTGLYKTDGTVAGTAFIKKFYSVSKFTVLNGVLYFFANDGVAGAELWSTDGTSGGTVLVKDINPGSGGSEVNFYPVDDQPAVYQNKLYFSATSGANTALWTSDGTTAGTALFNSNWANQLTIVNNQLFFYNDNGVMVTDGTAGGTITLFSYRPDYMLPFNNYIVFSNNGTIRMTDGTRDGTVTVTTAANQPSWIVGHQNALYFSDIDNTHGRELWKIDMVSPPTITSVTPDQANNLKFKITGTNFSTAQAVLIAGVAPVSYNIVSDTEIDVVIKNITINDVLRVNTSGGTATTTFTHVAVPVITSIGPGDGAAGTIVTITGDGFLDATGVAFGGVPAQSFTIVNNTTIQATVGPNGASGSVAVTTPAATVSGKHFQFYPVPTITSFTPDHGASGTTVTVTGTGFLNLSEVRVGATEMNFVSIDSTKLTIKPYVSGVIQITAGGGIVFSATPFTIDQPPVTTGIENEMHREITLYPNPADRLLRIAYNEAFTKNHLLSFLTVTGQRTTSPDVARDEAGCTVNVESLGPGLYVVVFSGPGMKTAYAKFVKQ